MRLWCSPSRRLALTSRRENGRPWACSRALAPLHGILQPPARLLVEREQLRAGLQRDLPENLDHGVQVLERIERKHVVAAGHEALRTAAILGRAGAAAPGADGIGLPSLRLQPVLDADLMAPGNVQVVLIDEPRALAESQRRQRHVRRRRRQLPRAVTRGAQGRNRRGGCPPSPSRPGSRRAVRGA